MSFIHPIPCITSDGGGGDPGGGTGECDCENFTYVHAQGIPSSVWIINHDLDYFPQITTVDSTGRVVEGDVVYTSATQITVTFSAPFAGTAYLS
jgi:hypothetical protein